MLLIITIIIIVPEICDIPSLDEVMRDFAASLYHLELKHSEDINEEAYLTEEIDKSKKNTENLQSDLKLSSNKYTYFQELRNYIIDLAEFLDEKVNIKNYQLLKK